MSNTTTTYQRLWIEKLLQRYLLPSLALVYVVSAFLPEWGIWLRTEPIWGTEQLGLGRITAVNLLLAGLLFNTGLAVPKKELLCLTRHPRLVALGMAIRITSAGGIIVGAILAGLFLSGATWNALLLGLVVIAVMPVANSSAGWSHHSEANVGLSMWLILTSVLLSPLFVPGLLELASRFADPEFASSYENVSRGYVGSFVMTWVIVPAVLGVIVRSLFLSESFPRYKSTIKVVTSLFLLTLNYANGSVSLPGLIQGGHWGLVLLVGGMALLFCGLLFVAAWVVSRFCHLPPRDSISVMYSTGMSNTGVALVLTTSALPELTTLHLLVIFYTLIQHVIAGIIDELLSTAKVTETSQAVPQRATPCTMTSQPVLNESSAERPTTQTGSKAAT